MKTKLLIIITILSTSFTWGQNSLTPAWQEALGGGDADKASYVINTSDNNLVWIGQYKSTDGDFSSNYGNYDVWIKKTDRHGSLLWQTVFGGTNADYLNCVTEDANGNFLTVGQSKSNDNNITGNHGNYDMLAVKISATGNIIWQKSLGGADVDKATSTVATSDGGFLVLGYSRSVDGDITTNAGNYDIWLVKLDATGNISWQKNYGGTGDDRSYSLISTTDGNFVFSGYSKSNNGDLTVNYGNYDYWIVKINPTGTIIWQKSLGGSSIEKEPDVIETTMGGYVVAGYSNSNNVDITNPKGNFDFWIVGLDANGTIVWNTSVGGTGADFAKAIAKKHELNADIFTVIGYSNSDDIDFDTNQGSYDAWAITLSETGSLLTKQSIGGSDADYMISISSDLCFVAGRTKSTDGDVVGVHGNYDAWLLGLDCGSGSITETTNIDVVFYPNPTSNMLNIEAKDIISAQIIDISGKILLNEKYTTIKDKHTINLSNFNSGTYFIKVVTSAGNAVKKMIIKK